VGDPDELLPPSNVLAFPKTIELEQRLARAELTITELRETISVLHKRIVSLQAQLDHVVGKITPF
jgi:uncharacterized coiled-coil protein SlyX